mmetsp:Transcript_23528/g.33682  ORF Transcript_23528/g.33682 Transcript_23528/m.33682 type:complete len:105 (-) Transcript_23528:85-399(-)
MGIVVVEVLPADSYIIASNWIEILFRCKMFSNLSVILLRIVDFQKYIQEHSDPMTQSPITWTLPSSQVEGETLPKNLRPVEGNAEMSDETAVVKDLESLESLCT